MLPVIITNIIQTLIRVIRSISPKTFGLVMLAPLMIACGGGGSPEALPDLDGDGLADAVDLDDDGDGVPDTNDAFPLISLGTNFDTDMDGRPDECPSDCQSLGMTADTDDDGDGMFDYEDPFPLDADALKAKKAPSAIDLLEVD